MWHFYFFYLLFLVLKEWNHHYSCNWEPLLNKTFEFFISKVDWNWWNSNLLLEEAFPDWSPPLPISGFTHPRYQVRWSCLWPTSNSFTLPWCPFCCPNSSHVISETRDVTSSSPFPFLDGLDYVLHSSFTKMKLNRMHMKLTEIKIHLKVYAPNRKEANEIE